MITLIAAAWLAMPLIDSSDTYMTAVGEQRVVELEDRSTLALNTQSQARVHFSAETRDVELLSGQAQLQVQYDSARPFRVHAAATVIWIQAAGTNFDVRLFDDGRVAVTVIEGTVQVSEYDRETSMEVGGQSRRLSRPATIQAGESAVIEPDGSVAPSQRIDPNAVTAWRRRQLRFYLAPLGEIADEFNRYNSAPQLRIEGEARAILLSGLFNARDPQMLISYLSSRGLSVKRQGDEIVIR